MSRKKFRKKDRQAIVDAEQEIDDDLREEITRQVGRRDFLKKAGTLAGVGAVGVGLGSMLGHSLASPGAGAAGTTISDTDIDAKRIGGVRYAADFITGTVPAGTDADPYPGSAIQAAIDDLPSQGGTVKIAEGYWDVSTALVLRSNLMFKGDGIETTIIRNIDATGENAIEAIGSSGEGNELRGITIRDLKVEGNVNSGHGIYLEYCTLRHRILNVYAQANGISGIALQNCWGVELTSIHSRGNEQDGFEFLADCNEIILTRCNATGYEHRYGVSFVSPSRNITLINCAFIDCTSAGAKLDKNRFISFYNCTFEQNGDRSVDILGDGSTQSRQIGFYDCFFYDETQGIRIDYGLQILIVNCQFDKNVDAMTGIQTTANAGNVLVINPRFEGGVDTEIGDTSGTVARLDQNSGGDLQLDRDFEINKDSGGLIVTTPNGSARYRIRIDNAGAVVTDAL